MEDYKNPSGRFVKNREGHKTFLPAKLPEHYTPPADLVSLLVEAHSNLSHLSGRGINLPNPHILIRPSLRSEAVESSKIEGTKASLSDILLIEAEGREPEEDDTTGIREVLNYIKALEDCLKDIENGKRISRETVTSAHRTLLYKVRGHQATLGEFRKVQNWLNAPLIELAPYVPPPPEHVPELFDDLVRFINNPPGDMPVLVQAALIHYQFEAIHPFVDGTGRIGRLILTLYLCEKKTLSQPLLYLSEYFERNRREYYYRLLRVSQNSEWDQWIRFFLQAANTQAMKSLEKIDRLEQLNREYHQKLREKDASAKTHDGLDYLFASPVTTISGLANSLGVTYVTAKGIITCLETAGILHEMTQQKRNKAYRAKGIIDIIQEPETEP